MRVSGSLGTSMSVSSATAMVTSMSLATTMGMSKFKSKFISMITSTVIGSSMVRPTRARRGGLAKACEALLCAAVLASTVATSPVLAAAQGLDANGQLVDPGLQARFERITHDLRCLVCQNESIADSNVDLAADLRREVREMLLSGKTDDQIFDFMTARYGEFVRFNPPLEPKTLLIWGAPFIMLLVGAGIVYRVVRQRSRMPLDDEPSPGPPS